MAKTKKEYPPAEILADLIFMLEQSYIIEHMQDHEKMKVLRKKYGVSL